MHIGTFYKIYTSSKYWEFLPANICKFRILVQNYSSCLKLEDMQFDVLVSFSLATTFYH
jgi:hypothetical protein